MWARKRKTPNDMYVADCSSANHLFRYWLPSIGSTELSPGDDFAQGSATLDNGPSEENGKCSVAECDNKRLSLGSVIRLIIRIVPLHRDRIQ